MQLTHQYLALFAWLASSSTPLLSAQALPTALPRDLAARSPLPLPSLRPSPVIAIVSGSKLASRDGHEDGSFKDVDEAWDWTVRHYDEEKQKKSHTDDEEDIAQDELDGEVVDDEDEHDGEVLDDASNGKGGEGEEDIAEDEVDGEVFEEGKQGGVDKEWKGDGPGNNQGDEEDISEDEDDGEKADSGKEKSSVDGEWKDDGANDHEDVDESDSDGLAKAWDGAVEQYSKDKHGDQSRGGHWDAEDDDAKGGSGDSADGAVEDDYDEVENIALDENDGLGSTSAAAVGGASSHNVSDVAILQKYATAAIALLSLNVILGICAILVGMMVYKRKNRKGDGYGPSLGSLGGSPRYAAVKLNEGGA